MEVKTIAVDFDGVLHSYITPWVAPHIIPDPPVEGAVEWWNRIAYEYDAYVLTTRAQTMGGIAAIRRWMKKYGFYVSPNLTITATKFAASIYVDDRGYRFTGDNFPSVEYIQNASRWGSHT